MILLMQYSKPKLFSLRFPFFIVYQSDWPVGTAVHPIPKSTFVRQGSVMAKRL